MAAELGESPDVVSRQSELLSHPISQLCALLKERPPRVVVTCARGSSAYAASFGKHLIERHLGIPGRCRRAKHNDGLPTKLATRTPVLRRNFPIGPQ